MTYSEWKETDLKIVLKREIDSISLTTEESCQRLVDILMQIWKNK